MYIPIIDGWSLFFCIAEILTLSLVPRCWLKKYNYENSIISFIPSFCTSVGVLLSFVTIWWVLSDLGDEQSGKVLFDSKELGGIIEKLAGKFIFSVIGIAFSIVWSIRIKRKLSEKENFEREERYAQENPHQILWDMRNILEYRLRTSESHLSTIIERVDGIEKSIGTKVGNQLEHILSGSESHLSTIIERVDGIEKSIGTKVGNQLEHILSGIKQEGQTLTGIYTSIANAEKSLGNISGQLKKTLADQIESMGQTVIKGMDELRQAIGAVLEERVAFFEDQSAEKISAIQEKIFTALDTLKDTTESNAGELSYAIYNINQTLEMLKDHLSAQVDSVQTHLNKDIQAKISAVLDNNTNEIKGIFERLELLRKQSETTLATTIKVFSASVASFKEAQGANKGVLDELEKQIETTSELQENIQKLYYFLISQEDEIERMNDHIQSIANMSKQLQNLSDTLSRLPIQQN
ncbi:MAG: hypothetical protein IT273_03785 [Chitinophagales bacterium]|nr:hypothetical protein [Chitinophagales bacterium]